MKIAAFIDGPNFYASVKQIGVGADYSKLLAWLRSQGDLVRALYYTALNDTEEHNPILPLIDWLSFNGFIVQTKPVKEFTDANGRRKVKGNMDIEIAVDMLDLADSVDHIFLFSGDGDFRRLVEAVQRKGVRVTVVSTLAGTSALIADDLRRQADDYIDISTIANLVKRDEPALRAA